MSWDCPHQSGADARCERLHRACKPLSPGCVLAGNCELLGPEKKEKPMNTNTTVDFDPQETVGALVTRLPQLRQALEQLGLDYCCGGKRSLAEAAAAAGVALETALAVLREAALRPAAEQRDWRSASTTALADHIVATHHAFTKSQLARIDRLLGRVQLAHRTNHGALLESLRVRFDALRSELGEHLLKEEEILFPAIREIDGYLAGRNGRPVVHCGSVAYPIRQMEHEHDGAGEALVSLRQLTDGYRPPADACETFRALYDALAALEADLHQHIHLENNVLFPASVRQEDQMNASGH